MYLVALPITIPITTPAKTTVTIKSGIIAM